MKRFIRLVLTLTLALGILAATNSSLISTASNFQTPSNTASGKRETARITLRGCADGIDPITTPQDCENPLDAPLPSSLLARDDPQSYFQSINEDAPREHDGAYVIEGVPAGISVTLRQFWPTEHNHFRNVGLNESADVGGPHYALSE